MKIPEIPLPDPTHTITVTRGSARSRRLQVLALRFTLWVIPAGAVDCVLTDAAGWGGRQPLWLTMMTTWLTLALTLFTFVSAVEIVGVRDGGEDAP